MSDWVLAVTESPARGTRFPSCRWMLVPWHRHSAGRLYCALVRGLTDTRTNGTITEGPAGCCDQSGRKPSTVLALFSQGSVVVEGEMAVFLQGRWQKKSALGAFETEMKAAGSPALGDVQCALDTSLPRSI